MKTEIVVSEKHIANAIPKDSRACMIADAIKDTFPRMRTMPRVDVQSIAFTHLKKRYTYFTPSICQERLLAFDQGEPVEPFTFRLSRPVRVRFQNSKPPGHESKEPRLLSNVVEADGSEVSGGGVGGSAPIIKNTQKPLPKAPLSNYGKGWRREYGLRQVKK